jgi:hypothetical protein
MYTPPPADKAAASSRAGALGAGPILAVCCLLCLLFVIAAVIILSIIPVYTPRKGAGQSNLSPTYYVIISYSGTVGSDGTLSSSACSAIAAAIQQAAGLSSGSTVSVSCTASSTPVSGKRKRRASQASRSRRGLSSNGLFFQLIYYTFQFNYSICPGCTTSFASKLLNLSFSLASTVFGTSGNLVCTILSISRTAFTIPAFSYTTSTAAVTTAVGSG